MSEKIATRINDIIEDKILGPRRLTDVDRARSNSTVDRTYSLERAVHVRPITSDRQSIVEISPLRSVSGNVAVVV